MRKNPSQELLAWNQRFGMKDREAENKKKPGRENGLQESLEKWLRRSWEKETAENRASFLFGVSCDIHAAIFRHQTL